MSAIDRSKAEWMAVSNDDKNWLKRLVIDKENKISIRSGEEDSFLNGYAFEVEIWQYIKPLPEKKTRPFTPLEFAEFVIKNPCYIRRKNQGDVWFFFRSICEEDLTKNINKLEYKLISDGSIQDFVNEVE